MPRPLRFVPANALVEVTTRTLQGRLLLKPSPELTDIILGVIGKAQDIYKMSIHAFVVMSTHAHFLCSPSSADDLARFMQFVNANIAKEAGRLHLWRERLWSRRYRSIVVSDEKSAARHRPETRISSPSCAAQDDRRLSSPLSGTCAPPAAARSAGPTGPRPPTFRRRSRKTHGKLWHGNSGPSRLNCHTDLVLHRCPPCHPS